MSTKYKQKNPFSEFCKEEGQVVINIIIIAIISILTLYFSINNSLIFFISIPISIFTIAAFGNMIKNYKNYVKKFLNDVKKIDEQKLIDNEIKLFNTLPIKEKKKYLNEKTNSLISSYVENYINIHEKIELLNNLIKIETELQKKFNDKFYSQINLINFNENLNLILNNIKKENDVKIYREERLLEEKIKFYTLFQIFNVEIYDMSLSRNHGITNKTNCKYIWEHKSGQEKLLFNNKN